MCDSCSSDTFSPEGFACAAWAGGGLSLRPTALHEHIDTARSVAWYYSQWLAFFLPLEVFNFWPEDVIAYTA